MSGDDAAFDWDAARARLAELSARLSESDAEDAEARQAVLRERARALAEAAVERTSEAAGEPVVVFTLGRSRYGLGADHVHRVVRLEAVSPVPSAPEALVGVTNLRGEVLPVYDLRRLFAMRVAGLDDLNRMLVIGRRRPELGVLANDVREIRHLPPVGLHAWREAPHEAVQPFVRGVTDDALVVLDGDALLRAPLGGRRGQTGGASRTHAPRPRRQKNAAEEGDT